MSQHDDELWFVQLPAGGVRAMSLDELDAAFQSGAIDEATLVRRDGTTAWVKLADELGDAQAAETPQPEHTPSVRPVVMNFDDDDLAPPFARRSRKGLIVGFVVAAVAAVAVAAVGAVKLGDVHGDARASVVNAVQAPVLPSSDPQPVAQKAALTEEQKKALADKDAELHQKMDLHRRDRATRATPETRTTLPPPFHDNGNAYDPLNSKL
jgi:hypothetical protein